MLTPDENYPPRPPLTGGMRPVKSVGQGKRRWMVGLTLAIWLAPLFVGLTLLQPPPPADSGLPLFMWQLPLIFNPAFAVALLNPQWLMVSLLGRVLLVVALWRGLHGREPAQISFAAIAFFDRLTQLWAAFLITESSLIAGYSPGFGLLYHWLVIFTCAGITIATVYFVIVSE
jgi:hypothetical protein